MLTAVSSAAPFHLSLHSNSDFAVGCKTVTRYTLLENGNVGTMFIYNILTPIFFAIEA